jgi:hypothetical protein
MTELEASIDAALRRLFEPPPRGALDAIVDRAVQRFRPAEEAAPAGVLRRHRHRRLAAAAAIAAAVLGGWQIWRAVGPPSRPPAAYRHQPWRSLETVYHDTVAAGFDPGWVCADDREFALTFRSLHHQGLLLADTPPGVETVGLAYCNSITPRTVCILARVGGEPVIVFVDRVERDAGQPPPPAGLNLFRRQIGRLVLYELSPIAEPSVLPWFSDPHQEVRP